MADINDPNTGTNQVAVGEKATGATGALHVTPLPAPHNGLGGHYRLGINGVTNAAQGASSKLLGMVNGSATKLFVPTRMTAKVQTIAAHTAILENSFDFFRISSATMANSGGGRAYPVPSGKYRSRPSRNQVNDNVDEGVYIVNTDATTTAGFVDSAFLTDSSPFCQSPWIDAQAVMAAADTVSRTFFIDNVFDDGFATHPFVFGQNEGFVVRNRVLETAAYSWYFDISWAEVEAF